MKCGMQEKRSDGQQLSLICKKKPFMDQILQYQYSKLVLMAIQNALHK